MRRFDWYGYNRIIDLMIAGAIIGVVWGIIEIVRWLINA